MAWPHRDLRWIAGVGVRIRNRRNIGRSERVSVRVKEIRDLEVDQPRPRFGSGLRFPSPRSSRAMAKIFASRRAVKPP